jgi:hypothetical protein
MKIQEKLAIGRAVCFSIVAPSVFFYNLYNGSFYMPLVLQLVLLTGYILGTADSVVSHKKLVTAFYAIAMFFIILNIVFTVISYKNKFFNFNKWQIYNKI